MTTDLNKQLKISKESHEALTRVKLELHGSESVRYSDVIENLAESALDRGDY